MDFDLVTTTMSHNARRIQSLIEGASVEQARWKPTPDSWSILETINHLYEEEQYDFRVRLDITLHHPDRPWPPIDPAGWVVERQYNQRELAGSLAGFLREREASLEWLKGLSAPDWEAVYQAPFGPITAGTMFASWAVHDLLHVRQLVELHWAYVGRLVEPHGVAYAGSW
jgi:hypothetical protein